jgi:hypothetical protein
MSTYESLKKAVNTNSFLDGRDTESAIVRNGKWVPIKNLHLILDLTDAEYDLVRLERSRASHSDEMQSIETVLNRRSRPLTKTGL